VQLIHPALNTVRLNAVEDIEFTKGRTNLGFDELGPNGISVVKRAGLPS